MPRAKRIGGSAHGAKGAILGGLAGTLGGALVGAGAGALGGFALGIPFHLSAGEAEERELRRASRQIVLNSKG